GVAVAALIIGLVIPRGGKPSAGDAKQEEEPTRQVIAEGKPEPKSDEASKLSSEALYVRVSAAVATIICKFYRYGGGKGVRQGSGFFLKDELVPGSKDRLGNRVAEFEKEKSGLPPQLGYLLTNYHVMKAALEGEIKLSNGAKG